MAKPCKKKLECYQIIGAMSRMNDQPYWVRMIKIYSGDPKDGQFYVSDNGIVLPPKKRGETIRVSYTTLDFKDF